MNKSLAVIVGALSYGGSALVHRLWRSPKTARAQSHAARKKANPFAYVRRRKQKRARS